MAAFQQGNRATPPSNGENARRTLSFFRPADALCILLILLCAILLFAAAPSVFSEDSPAVSLLVEMDGERLVYSLHEEQTLRFVHHGVTLTVRIEDEMAWVQEADCPDGVCRSMGRISRSGQCIVCAPAHLRLTIVGEEAKHDAIVR